MNSGSFVELELSANREISLLYPFFFRSNGRQKFGGEGEGGRDTFPRKQSDPVKLLM